MALIPAEAAAAGLAGGVLYESGILGRIARAAAEEARDLFFSSGTSRSPSNPAGRGGTAGRKRKRPEKPSKRPKTMPPRRYQRTSTVRQRLSRKRRRTVKKVRRKSKKLQRPKTTLHYLKYGSVIKKEAGGEVTDGQAVYVGHATSPYEVVGPAVVRALYRELLNQAKRDFTSWDDKPQNTVECFYTYFTDERTQTLATRPTLSFSSANAHADHANALYADIKAVFAAGPQPSQFVIKDIFIRLPTSNEIIGTVRMEGFMIDIWCQSRLSVQNRTLAQGTGVEDNRDAFTDIGQNPLIGKLYHGYGSGFSPSYRDEAIANTDYDSFMAKTSNGIIAATAVDNMSVETNKPPHGSFFRKTTKTKAVRIMPGAIQTSMLTYRKKCGILTWLRNHRTELADGTFNYTRSSFGKCAMIGVEKMLNSRVSEPAVLLGYEHSLKVCVSGRYYGHPVCAQITDIDLTANVAGA